jgi:chromosomal replication initiation ATPase DnaA
LSNLPRIRQLALPFPHAPRFDRMAFFEAPSNLQAVALLARPQAWPQHRLAVWGDAGSGKSHLLDRWARRHRATRLSGQGLQLEPPTGPLAIDDADLAAERPLLHVLNAASEAGFSVVIAGRAAPARWDTNLPDLDSRLRATLAVEIRPADDDLLRALLASLLADRQLPVPETVQEFLLRHLPRTPAALREATARLDHLALASGGRITRAMAAAVVFAIAEADPASLSSFHDDLTWHQLATSPDGPGFL